MNKLTDEERFFAEQHHNVIYTRDYKRPYRAGEAGNLRKGIERNFHGHV